MRVSSDSFQDGQRIPEECAFGKHDPVSHFTFAGNHNPHLRWSELPAGTRSLALICQDADAPSRADDVNQEGRTVPASLPRATFTHWVLVDLPATVAAIAAGEYSDGVTPRGKQARSGPHGTRQGPNDYTGWFAASPEMAGSYFGYDGPAPPWNDEIRHRYAFTLYALDVPACPVDGELTAAAVLAAIRGHVLAQATLTGVYAINPAVGI